MNTPCQIIQGGETRVNNVPCFSCVDGPRHGVEKQVVEKDVENFYQRKGVENGEMMTECARSDTMQDEQISKYFEDNLTPGPWLTTLTPFTSYVRASRTPSLHVAIYSRARRCVVQCKSLLATGIYGTCE